MKKLLFLALLGLTILSCKKENAIQQTSQYEYTGALGDVIRIIKEDTMTPSQVQTLLPPDFQGLITLRHNVRIFTVEYKSMNQQEDTVKASGLIFVPDVDSFAVPLTSYQHGTVLMKSDAPSQNHGQEFIVSLALACSDGVVACMPDYLGLGSGDGLHLYLNPTEEANSVRDIMRCARKLVKERDIAHLNGQVFLFGYSQGGHATMAAQRQLELENAEEFKLTATAPMAGPYALSRTEQFNIMLDSLFYPNPFYLPYLAVSLFHTFPSVYPSYSAVFKAPYDARIPDVIDGYHSFAYANSQFPYYISTIVIDSVREAIRNDPNHPIRVAAKAYDLVDNWTPKTPMHLYHCQGDDNVFYSNAVYADSAFRARGANCELINMGPAHHEDCAPPALLAAKLWVTGFFAPVRIK
jgi:hypothetical protein